MRASFWDEVEREVETLDWRDFAEFLAADRLPLEAAPGFRDRLEQALRGLVRRRYTI